MNGEILVNVQWSLWKQKIVVIMKLKDKLLWKNAKKQTIQFCLHSGKTIAILKFSPR